MAAANKGPKKRSKQLNISTIISGDGRPIRLGRLQEDDRSSAALPSSPIETQPESGPDDAQGNNNNSLHFTPEPTINISTILYKENRGAVYK